MVPVNRSDFPTNTTGAIPRPDGTLERAPLYVIKGQFSLPKPGPDSHTPLAPNDIPAPSKRKSSKKKSKGGAGAEIQSTDEARKRPVGGSSLSQTSKDQVADAEKTQSSDGNLQKRGGGEEDDCDPVPRGRNGKQRNNQGSQGIKGEDIIDQGTGWNGRLAMLANGAQRGFIPLPDVSD